LLKKPEKKKKCLIFGGHSPIAIAISQQLSKGFHVTHVTRTIDRDLLKIESDNLKLVKFDIGGWFSNTSSDSWENLDLANTSKLIFCHRFRGNEDLMKSFVTEVANPFKLSEKWLETSLESDKTIIFFTSPAHYKILADQDVSYHINKSAIAKVVSFLAVKYAHQNTNVFGVSPGSFVQKKRAQSFYESNPELYRKIIEKIPRKRFVKPIEIAQVVHLLCTKNLNSLSGSIFELDNLSRFLEFSSVLK
jgi:NADP-dependent 3-hydroxy acid dehydrogenase YdfG